MTEQYIADLEYIHTKLDINPKRTIATVQQAETQHPAMDVATLDDARNLLQQNPDEAAKLLAEYLQQRSEYSSNYLTFSTYVSKNIHTNKINFALFSIADPQKRTYRPICKTD